MSLYKFLLFVPLNCSCADPVVCVPSSFFIGDNGIPLEVIAGSVSVEELVTRIHKVKQVTLAGRLELSHRYACVFKTGP